MDDESAGYKKPPKAGQFKPGQSGNPKGRPKGSRNLKTDLNNLMKKRITIREGGKARSTSALEAVLLSLFGSATRGDVRASTTLINTVMKLNPDTKDDSESSNISESDEELIKDFFRRHSLTDEDGNGNDKAR